MVSAGWPTCHDKQSYQIWTHFVIRFRGVEFTRSYSVTLLVCIKSPTMPTNCVKSKWCHSRLIYMSWLTILPNINNFCHTVSEELRSLSVTDGWTETITFWSGRGQYKNLVSKKLALEKACGYKSRLSDKNEDINGYSLKTVRTNQKSLLTNYC